MNIELKDIELIDQYLSGQLSVNEQEAVTARLRSDAEFQELFGDFQETNQLVRAHELSQVKSQLDSFSYEGGQWWQSGSAKIGGMLSVALVAGVLLWNGLASSESSTAVMDKKKDVATVPTPSSASSAISVQAQETLTTPAPVSSKVNSITGSTNKENTSAHSSGPVIAPDLVAAPPQQQGSVGESTPAVVPPRTEPTKAPVQPVPDVSVEQPVPVPAPVEVLQTKFIITVPQQVWEFPSYIDGGAIQIVDQNGRVITEKNVSAAGESWDATDKYGTMVGSGLYFFTYTDSDSGKVYTGSITVVY